MGTEERVTITINREQSQVLHKALDLFSRLLMGQVEELDFFFRTELFLRKNMSVDIEKLRYVVRCLKQIAFPEFSSNESYSIGSPEGSEKAKVAYDILQKLRFELYKHDVAAGKEVAKHTVNSSPPMVFSTEPLPDVKIDDNAEDPQ